ncbi:MAG: M48 family metallopeptidase [Polyangiaceae bacterium]|nr:M48 family metallopeptidase [Polyangiaceae bacterium]
MIERSEVRWGGTEIPYVVRRSERRGTVGIAVQPSGAVVLTAPRTVSLARLDGVVRQKAKWIVDRLRRRSTVPPPRARELVSGEGFRYLGRQYRLRLLQGDPVRGIALRGGWLELPVPLDLDGAHQTAYARAALIDWYVARARERLRPWAAAWAERAQVDFHDVIVADQAKRWGSCSKGGVLRFNWRIIQAPRSLVDYVLAHEITHIRHEHHGAEFWAALGRIMPDYEDRRERLRTLGTELVW